MEWKSNRPSDVWNPLSLLLTLLDITNAKDKYDIIKAQINYD